MDLADEILVRLDRYIDDELPADERGEFERRLGEDPELSRALAERREAMGLLAEWSAAPEAAPRAGAAAPARFAALRLALAVAAAALVAVSAALLFGGTPEEEADGRRLRMRTMAEGVSVSRGGIDGTPELVVDPFPMKWRTLREGVQVIRSESDDSDVLLVDPFPEEGE